MSSLIEIHKRLEKIDVLKLENVIANANLCSCTKLLKFDLFDHYCHEIEHSEIDYYNKKILNFAKLPQLD